MKGIILAGGSGTRLYPLTHVVSKQLLPVYDKPMVYYPLSTLMQAGIREILIISTPQDIPRFKDLLGDGHQYGLQLSYAEQQRPEGLAQAFVIGSNFIGDDAVCLILGDNIFHGPSLQQLLKGASQLTEGATVFGYPVERPEDFGVLEFDHAGNVLSIEEKPTEPKSNFVVPGIYFCDNTVIELARSIEPSGRGEYEITDVLKAYLLRGKLSVELLDRGCAWLDTGTHTSLHEAAHYVATIQQRQGTRIGCIEETAYRMGYVGARQIEKLAQRSIKSQYGQYLLQMLEEDLGAYHVELN